MTGVEIRWDVRIPVRDGMQLSAILYLPRSHREPGPVLCTVTPYIAQTHHEQGVYFAEHGYRFLSVDARGRGNSDGVFEPIAHDAEDAFGVIEWLATQPYCDGKVAMWGGSYMGYVQWAAAKEFPPHLMTIVPVAAPFRGGDSPLRNNMFVPYNVQWLLFVSGRALQDKIFADGGFWNRAFRMHFEAGRPFAELDSFVGCPSPVFQDWLAHPHRGHYWDRYNPSAEQYSRISLPILTITGSFDGNQPGALMHYREHMKHASVAARAKHYLVIGPWDHAGTRNPQSQFCGITVGPESLVDISKLHREWYAWTLGGGPKPSFLEKNVAYYVMGADRWRYADTLEEATARVQTLYLSSTVNPTDVFASGALLAEPSDGRESDHYIYDPQDVDHAELEVEIDPECRTDQRLLHRLAGKHLVYHSIPFAADTEITGCFELCVWLSIDQPDTDFRADIYEVQGDGSVIRLTSDTLRARHRDSFREEKLIATTEPLAYEFTHFMFVSREIKRGHRLRLVIGPINSIYAQKNYNSGGVVCRESMLDARPVNVRLFHDRSRPSALYVPLGRPGD